MISNNRLLLASDYSDLWPLCVRVHDLPIRDAVFKDNVVLSVMRYIPVMIHYSRVPRYSLGFKKKKHKKNYCCIDCR